MLAHKRDGFSLLVYIFSCLFTNCRKKGRFWSLYSSTHAKVFSSFLTIKFKSVKSLARIQEQDFVIKPLSPQKIPQIPTFHYFLNAFIYHPFFNPAAHLTSLTAGLLEPVLSTVEQRRGIPCTGCKSDTEH